MNPQLIEEKYINLLSPQLEMFKWKKNNLANVRCPICGDSQKKKRLARGYFYLSKNQRFRYKCHNCGCNLSTNEMLEKISPHLHAEYRLEYLKELGVGKKEKVTKREGQDYSQSRNVTNGQTGIPRELETLTPVNTLPVFSSVYRYIKEERQIPKDKMNRLYYTDNLQAYVKKLYTKYGHNIEDIEEKYPKDARIVIPTIDSDNKLIAMSCRAVGDTDKALRYITVKLDEFAPKVFGMNHVDFNKKVYVVEGQIDSLYLPNALAVGGSSLHIVESLLSPTEHGVDIVYVHDNQPRNREIVREVKRSVESGAKVCIWGPNTQIKYGKDIGTMIEYGMTPEQVRWEIDKRTFTDIQARLEYSRWAKI